MPTSHQPHNHRRFLLAALIAAALWILVGCRASPEVPVEDRPSPPTGGAVPTATSTEIVSPTVTSLPVSTPTSTPSPTYTPTPTTTPTATPLPPPESYELLVTLDEGMGPSIYLVDANDWNNITYQELIPSGYIPKWSPDGRFIGYIGEDPGGVSRLFLFDVLTNQISQIDHPNVYNFAWSFDGSELAVASYVDELFSDINQIGINQIYKYNLETGQIQFITEDRDVFVGFLQYSPTSDELLVIWSSGAQTYMTILGNHLDHAIQSIGGVDWNPDGSWIVYDSFFSYSDDRQGIYIARSDGSGETLISPHGQFAADPDWSNDGKKIAFTLSDDDNVQVLHIINLETNEIKLLYPGIAQQKYRNWGPSWSGDDRYIAYVVETADRELFGNQLFIVDVGAGETQTIIDKYVHPGPVLWKP